MRSLATIWLWLLATCLLGTPALAGEPKDPVLVEGDRIVLAAPILFTGPILKPQLADREPVEALASFLLSRPNITSVMIEAHLAEGDIRYSIDPGRNKARQIRDALVVAGVDPLRLEARSFGEERPIADPRKPASKAINRRIELRIRHQREPTGRDLEAAEMVGLSLGPPPKPAALCPAAAKALETSGAGRMTRAWVAYWLGPGRPWFERWRRRCEVVWPLVAPVAKKAGLPDTWPALMMIESGCNPQARSRLDALGLWQFMPATARGLGLQVGGRREERRRLQPATQAAGKLLASLHAELGDWDLALTAYNAGPGTVHQALLAGGCQTLACLQEAGGLSPEARNFVPKIRAAVFLMARWDALAGP